MAFKRSAVRSRLSPPNLVPETHRFRNFFVYIIIFLPPKLQFFKPRLEAPQKALEAPPAESSRIASKNALFSLSNTSFVSIASKFFGLVKLKFLTSCMVSAASSFTHYLFNFLFYKMQRQYLLNTQLRSTALIHSLSKCLTISHCEH